jgi:hypothetical protein
MKDFIGCEVGNSCASYSDCEVAQICNDFGICENQVSNPISDRCEAFAVNVLNDPAVVTTIKNFNEAAELENKICYGEIWIPNFYEQEIYILIWLIAIAMILLIPIGYYIVRNLYLYVLKKKRIMSHLNLTLFYFFSIVIWAAYSF